MNKKKREIIGTIENAAVELDTYLKIANSYVYAHCYHPEVLHIGLIINKMSEHVEKLHNLFVKDEIEILR